MKGTNYNNAQLKSKDTWKDVEVSVNIDTITNALTWNYNLVTKLPFLRRKGTMHPLLTMYRSKDMPSHSGNLPIKIVAL